MSTSAWSRPSGRDHGLAAGTRLVIVRHGEAACNVESYIGGHRSCRGLTERGRGQMDALARRLARTGELGGAVGLYTSELRRAIESAEILAPVLGGQFVSDCDLCERHPGEADGLTWDAYEQTYGRTSLPGDNPEEVLAPGGETWVEFLDRAAEGLVRSMRAHPGGLVVVVAHGGVIDASLVRFLEVAADGTRIRLHPEHASITEWTYTGSRFCLVRYSDAAHLAEPEAASLVTVPPSWVRLEPGLPAAPNGAYRSASG